MMEAISGSTGLGPVQGSNVTSSMDELLPLVLQLTSAEQVRNFNMVLLCSSYDFNPSMLMTPDLIVVQLTISVIHLQIYSVRVYY
jgi:hypothetical protein